MSSGKLKALFLCARTILLMQNARARYKIKHLIGLLEANMDRYEKNVDKAVGTLEKAGKVANRVRLGCWIIFANLFFAGFCAWGVYAGYIAWMLETEGVSAIGRVIRLDENSDGEGACCTYSPVIEFTASDSQTYTFDSQNSSYPPAYEVGEEVSVLYDPQNPQTAQINKWTERWLMPLILIPAMIFTGLLLNFFLFRSFIRNDMVE